MENATFGWKCVDSACEANVELDLRAIVGGDVFDARAAEHIARHAQDEADRAAGAAMREALERDASEPLDDAALAELREDRANGAALRRLVATGVEFDISHYPGGSFIVALPATDHAGDTLPEAVSAALGDP